MKNQIIADFQSLDSWEEKYEYIIGLSRKLELYPDVYKKPQYFINGCQSRTWLYPKVNEDKTIHWLAYSDSLFVRGLIYILLIDFQDKNADELTIQEPTTIQKLELEKYITAGRRNGLGEAIKRIKNI